MIKNLRYFLILIFISFTVAKAQTPYNQEIHFGIKCGFTNSVFTKNVVPFDKKAPGYANSRFEGWANDFYSGFNLGLTLDYRFSENLTLATELYYHNRGAMYNKKSNNVVLVDTAGNQSDAYDDYNYNLYYLEIPLIVQYHIKKNGKQTYSRVYGGIAPAVLLSASTSYHYYQNNDETGEANDFTVDKKLNYVNRFEVSPIVGFWFGDTNPKHKLKVFFDFRFEYSFLSAFNRSSIEGSNLQTNIYSADMSIGVRL